MTLLDVYPSAGVPATLTEQRKSFGHLTLNRFLRAYDHERIGPKTDNQIRSFLYANRRVGLITIVGLRATTYEDCPEKFEKIAEEIKLLLDNGHAIGSPRRMVPVEKTKLPGGAIADGDGGSKGSIACGHMTKYALIRHHIPEHFALMSYSKITGYTHRRELDGLLPKYDFRGKLYGDSREEFDSYISQLRFLISNGDVPDGGSLGHFARRKLLSKLRKLEAEKKTGGVPLGLAGAHARGNFGANIELGPQFESIPSAQEALSHKKKPSQYTAPASSKSTPLLEMREGALKFINGLFDLLDLKINSMATGGKLCKNSPCHNKAAAEKTFCGPVCEQEYAYDLDGIQFEAE